MKRFLIVSILTLSSLVFAFGQNQKEKIETQKIHVSGNCGECKQRIENAANLPGVKQADWNKDSKILTITFKPEKVSLKEIEQHIANAGHDAGDIMASDSAYNQLPKCCAYRTEKGE